MRITYRAHGGSQAYWNKRWQSIDVDRGDYNPEKYPGRYAEEVISRVDGRLLEAGCGNGRVLINLHNRGYNISGFDFISAAVEKIKSRFPEIDVISADILNLPYAENSFSGVMAFGLYHSLPPENIPQALKETHRVLQDDGLLIASIRADNIQNFINDFIENQKIGLRGKKSFHKVNLEFEEAAVLFEKSGFVIERIEPIENMPLLYKFRIFRAKTHKKFNETVARAEGYKLSNFGRTLQNYLLRNFPSSVCNVFVIVARKNSG